MKLIIPILVFTCFFKVSFAQNKQDTLIRYLESRIDSMPDGFAISVGIIKNGEAKHLGFKRVDGQSIFSELKDSLFEIGSLTKVFTSTVLANQVLSNKIKLTSRVNKFFPFKFYNKINPSFQSLANHTSGSYRLPSNILSFLINNPENPYSAYSFDLFDTYLKDELSLEQTDYPKYSYSNLGAGLLAYSLSKLSNENYDSLLKRLVFNKYELTKTFYDRKTSFSGIGINGKPVENWQFNALKGAGGIISSTNDLSKFILAQFNQENNELALTRKETFKVSENLSVGLAWHILKTKNEDQKFWHNGGTGGFTSSISFRTSNNTGVIILSNISAMHKESGLIDELCFELLDLLK